MGRLGVLRSLRSRLMIAVVSLVLMAMLVLVAFLPGVARTHELAVLEDRLADQAHVVADYVVSELDQGRGSDLDALAKRLGERTQSRITIIAVDGSVLGESTQDLSRVGNHAGRREVQQALTTGRGTDIHRSETVGYAMLYVAVPIVRDNTTLGTARAALRLSEVDRLVADLTRTILWTALGTVLLAALAALLAARAITSPLAQLTRLAEALSRDPARAIGTWLHGGPAEIALLGGTLERMAKGIRESLLRVAAERDRLDAVLANLTDGIVMIDASGTVTRVNKAAESLLRFPASRAQGQTAATVLRDHELVALVAGVRDTTGATEVATRFVEWSKPHVFLRAVASRFGSDESNQMLLVLQDLTELRQLETVRRDFVANVSHELRTPVSAIKAMTETLHDGAIDDPEAARDFLCRIEQEVDGLHRVIEELLELSRLESGRLAFNIVPLDPSWLVASAAQRLAAMAERAQVSLTVTAPSGLPAVAADPDRIGQVLVNLIHNAIKFTPPGGKITVHAQAEDGTVRLSVCDTGAGIAPDALPRIFERFYKIDHARSSGGTGLGLAIAKHTVQLHSGQIWAESLGPGHGATVHVSLPQVAHQRPSP